MYAIIKILIKWQMLQLQWMNCKKLQPSFIIIKSLSLGSFWLSTITLMIQLSSWGTCIVNIWVTFVTLIGVSMPQHVCMPTSIIEMRVEDLTENYQLVSPLRRSKSIVTLMTGSDELIWLNLNQRGSFLFHPCLNATSLLPYYNMYHTERISCYGIHNMDCILFWPPTS